MVEGLLPKAREVFLQSSTGSQHVCWQCSRGDRIGRMRRTDRPSNAKLRHAGRKEVRWKIKKKLLEGPCLDGGVTSRWKGKALMDRLPSPLWHIINLKSKQIAPRSVSAEPCASITPCARTTCQLWNQPHLGPSARWCLSRGPSCLVRPTGLGGPAAGLDFRHVFLSAQTRTCSPDLYRKSKEAAGKNKKREKEKSISAEFCSRIDFN